MVERDVLVTGGAGRIGRHLCPALAGGGHRVTSVDRVTAGLDQVDEHVVDIADLDAMQPLLERHDALVHLAGELDGENWDALEFINVTATRRLIAAALAAGVRTIVYASSIHAGGYASTGARFEPGRTYAADSPYGVSKRCGEAMLEMLAIRAGVDAYALRIGTCRDVPLTLRETVTWLSPADAARLVSACLSGHPPGFRLVWALSANSAADVDRAHWEAIGYRPQDDASRFEDLSSDPAVDGAGFGLIGGRFVRGQAVAWSNPRV